MAGFFLPRASTIKRKTPLIITQSGRVAKRRHRSFTNALKTTEDEDFSLKKKQTTRKDDDDGAFFFERKSLRDESDGDVFERLVGDDVVSECLL